MNERHGRRYEFVSQPGVKEPTTMKRFLGLTGLCLLGLFAGTSFSGPFQREKGEAPPARTSPRAQDETALRGLVANFTRAFNAGDARALGALFGENARIVTEEGRAIEGRSAIEAQFARAFEENPGQTIAIKTESLRFLGPSGAIEEGSATITTPGEPGEPPAVEVTRYSAAYVKHGDKWLHDSIRDYPSSETEKASTPHEHLKDLEWMVGEWVDESDAGQVETSCKWSENGSFLVRSFQLRVRGQAESTGTQQIGWDPRLKQVRSWAFDADGGVSEGLWYRDGKRWIIKSRGVVKDGETVTATNIVTPENRDRIRLRVTDRTVGAEVLPDVEEIILVRKPPRPSLSRKSSQPPRTPQ